MTEKKAERKSLLEILVDEHPELQAYFDADNPLYLSPTAPSGQAIRTITGWLRSRPLSDMGAQGQQICDAFAIDDFGDLFDKLINYFRNADEDADAMDEGPRRPDWSFRDIERTIKSFRDDIRKNTKQAPEQHRDAPANPDDVKRVRLQESIL